MPIEPPVSGHPDVSTNEEAIGFHNRITLNGFHYDIQRTFFAKGGASTIHEATRLNPVKDEARSYICKVVTAKPNIGYTIGDFAREQEIFNEMYQALPPLLNPTNPNSNEYFLLQKKLPGDLLSDLHPKLQQSPWFLQKKVCVGILQAIADIHEGKATRCKKPFIHGDLKSNNILLVLPENSKNRPSTYLIDFGTSEWLGKDTNNIPLIVSRSAPRFPPESTRSTQPHFSKSSDVFTIVPSLIATLRNINQKTPYKYGNPPAAANNTKAMLAHDLSRMLTNASLPRALQYQVIDYLLKLLDYDEANRPSAREAADYFNALPLQPIQTDDYADYETVFLQEFFAQQDPSFGCNIELPITDTIRLKQLLLVSTLSHEEKVDFLNHIDQFDGLLKLFHHVHRYGVLNMDDNLWRLASDQALMSFILKQDNTVVINLLLLLKPDQYNLDSLRVIIKTNSIKLLMLYVHKPQSIETLEAAFPHFKTAPLWFELLHRLCHFKLLKPSFFATSLFTLIADKLIEIVDKPDNISIHKSEPDITTRLALYKQLKAINAHQTPELLYKLFNPKILTLAKLTSLCQLKSPNAVMTSLCSIDSKSVTPSKLPHYKTSLFKKPILPPEVPPGKPTSITPGKN